MTAVFTKAPQEIVDLVGEAMKLYHPALLEHEPPVTIAVVMAEAVVDDDGNPKGSAMEQRGHAIMACVKVVAPELRVLGLADVLLKIDADRWPLLSKEEKLAVLDHELTHIELKGDLDDGGRPKIKMRHHDWEMGGFDEVASRHGDDSLERQWARQRISDSPAFDGIEGAPKQPELALTPKVGRALRQLQEALKESGAALSVGEDGTPAIKATEKKGG